MPRRPWGAIRPACKCPRTCRSTVLRAGGRPPARGGEEGDAARREGERAVVRYLDQINQARMQGGVPPLPVGELSIDRLVAEGRVAMGTPDECADIVERARQALGLTGVD